MFKCGLCKRQTNPKEKGVMRTIETRVKEYYNKQGQYQGTGEEIVMEYRVCATCVEVGEKYPYVEAVENLVQKS